MVNEWVVGSGWLHSVAAQIRLTGNWYGMLLYINVYSCAHFDWFHEQREYHFNVVT